MTNKSPDIVGAFFLALSLVLLKNNFEEISRSD